MKLARLGPVGEEIPVALVGDVCLDLRSVTADIDGRLLASDGLFKVARRLADSSLPELAAASVLRVGSPSPVRAP